MLFCGVGFLAGMYAWYRSRRAETGLFARRIYVRESMPIFVRNVGLMPIWGTGLLMGASLVLLPRWLAQWATIPMLVVVLVAFMLSYRVPAPFLPRWLRDEIEQGVTPVARPDFGDWLLFAAAVALAVIGIPAGVILIVVFGGGTAAP